MGPRPYAARMEKLVLTVHGDERPGLVAALAEEVARFGGNWAESQLVVLGGKFAGIVLVEIPRANRVAFSAALPGLETSVNLTVTADSAVEQEEERLIRSLAVVGQDRPGIVAEISSALASWGVVITNLVTYAEETPMTDGLVFAANLLISIPPEVDETDVMAVIEGLSGDLMVDFDDLDFEDLLDEDLLDEEDAEIEELMAGFFTSMLDRMGAEADDDEDGHDDEDHLQDGDEHDSEDASDGGDNNRETGERRGPPNA